MANKRFSDLPEATSSTVGDVLPIDGVTTRKITVENLLANNLVAIKGLTSAADKGIQFTGAGTAATYDLTAAGKAILDDADSTAQRATLGLVIGTDVQAYDADLAALAANSTDGLWAHTGAGTGSARTLTAPAAGITITNPAGIAGNPTLVLANDLAALEGLASTGIARRTGSDAWSVGTAVSNAELATMAAFTFKGNNTSGAATPTDVDIAALTTKASPAAGDYVILSDQAASGAWKKATVSSVSSAGSVSSIAGNTGSFTLSGGITNSTNDIRLDPGYLQNFLAGLGLANNGSDAVNDIDISAGVAADSTNVALMKLSSALTKQLDAAWAVGTNAGGRMSAAAIANTTYFVWLIQRSDTGVVDCGFDVSASAPTMPTNYDRKRRIGAIVRTGGAIKAFTQDGNKFNWNVPVADYSDAISLGTSPITKTITVPVGIRVEAYGNLSGNVSSSCNVVVYDLTTTPPATSPFSMLRISTAASLGGATWRVYTNTSGQIGWVQTSSSATHFMSLAVEGYYDYRGQ